MINRRFNFVVFEEPKRREFDTRFVRPVLLGAFLLLMVVSRHDLPTWLLH